MKEIDNLEELGAEGEIILKCVFGNRVVWCGLDTSGSGQGQVIILGKETELLILAACDDFSKET